MALKVMVCDENEMVRDVLGGCLSRKGYEVTQAQSGEECVELFKNQDFDVIFLDINSPDLDGILVSQELRKLKKKVEVILMSGFDKSQLKDADSCPSTDDAAFNSFSLENVTQLLLASGKTRVDKILFIDDHVTPLEMLKDFLKGDSFEMRDSPKHNKILVVDDQDLLREFLSEFLSGEGYEVTEARNGKECLERAREQEFDAIFMDIRMPEMDGIEALKKLREHGVLSKVFLMSGYSDVQSDEDAIKLGAQNFLQKPFQLDKAREILGSH